MTRADSHQLRILIFVAVVLAALVAIDRIGPDAASAFNDFTVPLHRSAK